MSHVLFKVGHFAGRRPWRVVAVWLLVAVAAVMLRGSIGGQPDETFTLPGSESQRAADAIDDAIPAAVALRVRRHLPHRPRRGVAAGEGRHQRGGRPALRRQPCRRGRRPVRPQRLDGQLGRHHRLRRRRLRHAGGSPADFDTAEKATAQARAASIEVEYDNGLGYAKGDSEPGSEMIASWSPSWCWRSRSDRSSRSV